MGLTGSSTGLSACDTGTFPEKERPEDLIFALAGNPNVGKSTVYNELTGLKQHTGNWPGKTVATAWGKVSASPYASEARSVFLVDLPGCYSLLAHSAEEEVARDFICFGNADAVIVVCDATCLERNMNLVLQTIEITPHTIVCVNLLDEAARRGIRIDTGRLSERLGVPVIGAAARSGKGLTELMDAAITSVRPDSSRPVRIEYDSHIEKAVSLLLPALESLPLPRELCAVSRRFLALRLLEQDAAFRMSFENALSHSLSGLPEPESPSENTCPETWESALGKALRYLEDCGIRREDYQDLIVRALIRKGEALCSGIELPAANAGSSKKDVFPETGRPLSVPDSTPDRPQISDADGCSPENYVHAAQMPDPDDGNSGVYAYSGLSEGLRIGYRGTGCRNAFHADCPTASSDAAAGAAADRLAGSRVTGKGKPSDTLDRLTTSKWFGFPLMFLLLAGIFWLTINGANYPSSLLSGMLFWLEDRIFSLFAFLRMPVFLNEMLVHGMYRVLAWVVSVMLPPMAIFFPLFTLLEDFGYLPRVAFNLDKCFHKCKACGKQALSMCMGFGCNAAGIVGCRIIDSPRERLIAMLTNNFVPCNGRFPALITILTIFFVMPMGDMPFSSLFAALLLALLIVLGILVTFLMSRFLSETLLKGVPSSFTLELPPFRRPQVGKVIVRSIFDRTLFVLGRAVVVAAPAGLLIWLMANLNVGGISLLHHCCTFLDPFAHFIGLDGVILMAFILGFPANEIVIPLMIMTYMAEGTLVDLTDLAALRSLFAANGWTMVTALCFMLFSLMHWPCSTTLLTIHKESGSLRWTALAFLLPAAAGIAVCAAVNWGAKLLGLLF